jgi:hypothetical protein
MNFVTEIFLEKKYGDLFGQRKKFSADKKIFFTSCTKAHCHEKKYSHDSLCSRGTPRQDFINGHPIAFLNSSIVDSTMVSKL